MNYILHVNSGGHKTRTRYLVVGGFLKMTIVIGSGEDEDCTKWRHFFVSFKDLAEKYDCPIS